MMTAVTVFIFLFLGVFALYALGCIYVMGMDDDLFK